MMQRTAITKVKGRLNSISPELYASIKRLYRAVKRLYRAVKLRIAPTALAKAVLHYGGAANFSKKDRKVFCDYFSFHNAGIYSNMSTSLEDVMELYHAGISVKKIDYSAGMSWFKDEIGKDVYPEFFDSERYRVLDIKKDLHFEVSDVHKLYKKLPLGDLCKVASILFYPSPSVIKVANAMIESYGISRDRTIAIVYRGTDKDSEVKLASIANYIQVADKLLREGAADLEIVVQTDQEQARDEVLTTFGNRCRFLTNLPVTRGKTVIHELEFGTDIKMSREQFAKRMMAAGLILSKCAYVITHTGNVGAWVAIYRGTSKNLYQFDANGRLEAP